MAQQSPITELDEPYSDANAEPVDWSVSRDALDAAGVYWLATVRSDGRPHVTPVAAVLVDGSLFFSTGPTEQKARNLEGNTNCVVTTGCNDFKQGLDVIIEGMAVRTVDRAKLERLAGMFLTKYDDFFGFEAGEDAFVIPEGVAHVFEVAPIKAFAYERSERGSATRYRF